MKAIRALFAVIAVTSAVSTADGRSHPKTVATVQDGGMCWMPDVEFPVPCDDGDDD